MMTFIRYSYSIFFLALVMLTDNTQLNAMEVYTPITKICQGCSCHYHADNIYNVTGFDTPCQHGLCPDCFLGSTHRHFVQEYKNLCKIYRCIMDLECPTCKQTVSVGLQKKFEEGSTQNLIEILCAGFGHTTKLLKAIDQVRKKCSPEITAELLKRALISRNRSLFDIKGHSDNTVLHDACCDNYDKVIKIILLAAGSQAGDLVCVKNSLGQTALYYAVKNAKSYGGPLDLVEELLKKVLCDATRWNLINEKCLCDWKGEYYSVLMYAQTGAKVMDHQAQKLIDLLISYLPKDFL